MNETDPLAISTLDIGYKNVQMLTRRVLFGEVQVIPPWTREMSIEKLPPPFSCPFGYRRTEQGKMWGSWVVGTLTSGMKPASVLVV